MRQEFGGWRYAGAAIPNENERDSKNCQTVYELIGESRLEPLKGLRIKSWTKPMGTERSEQYSEASE